MKIDRKSNLISLTVCTLISILFLYSSVTPIQDYDYGFHLRTGEDIIKNLKFPVKESYSYTAAGNFNPVYSWIFDAFLYMFYAISGTDGLMLLQIILVFAMVLILLIRVLKIKTGSDSPIHYLLIINIFLMLAFFYFPRIMIRPQLMGNLLLVLFLFLIPSIFSKDYANLKFKGLFKSPLTLLTVILTLFWVNIHSSFVEVYVILFTGITVQFLKNSFILKNDKIPLKNILILLFILILLCMINPSFYRVFDTFVPSVKYTEEFFSLFQILPKSGWEYALIVSGYLCLLLMLVISLIGRKDYLKSSILLAFMLLGIFSVRFLADMGIAAAVFLIIEAPVLTVELNKSLKIRALIFLTILIPAQLFLLYTYRRPAGWGLERNIFPVSASVYLNKLNIEGNMFNAYEWGGYLIWELKKYRVYIDGRIQIYPEAFINSYRDEILKNPPLYFNDQANYWKISFAIVPYSTRIGNLILNNYSDYLFNKKNWALIYFDNTALVYMKRNFSSSNDLIINRHEYRFLEPTIMAPPVLEKYLQNEITRAKLIKELRRSIDIFPDSIYSHFCMGYCEFKSGNIDGAIKELEITKILYPNSRVAEILDSLKSIKKTVTGKINP